MQWGGLLVQLEVVAVRFKAEGANRFCCNVVLLQCLPQWFVGLVSWSFLCYPICMLQCNMKIFHITCNLNVTIIGIGNLLRNFLLARLHWEADFLQKHILQCGKFLVAWRSWVLCPFPFLCQRASTEIMQFIRGCLTEWQPELGPL